MALPPVAHVRWDEAGTRANGVASGTVGQGWRCRLRFYLDALVCCMSRPGTTTLSVMVVTLTRPTRACPLLAR